MLRNRLDIQLRNVCLIFRVYSWLQSLWTPWTPFAPSLEPLEYTAESRDRTGSQHDRGQKCFAGSRRCELPGMHSVPTSAVLPYASGVGGLSRRLLNKKMLPKSPKNTHPYYCKGQPTETLPVNRQKASYGSKVDQKLRQEIEEEMKATKRMIKKSSKCEQ